MKVFIIGGTGFIGYHAVLEFLKRGHRISTLALPPLPASDLFPPEVAITLADLGQTSDQELRGLLRDHDALVYAAGADDRTIPKRPAYDLFFRANVETPQRVFELARQAGIRRGVVIGSYFAYFDRVWPEMRLAGRHPYIRSRQAQVEACFAASLPALELMILELPYVFGAMPGRVPLWRPLIQYLRSPWPLFYPRGGTNVIAVESVAEAIAGAIERGRAGEIYQVGGENLSWVELLARLSRLAGREKRVITLPDVAVQAGMMLIGLIHHVQGRESGLNPAYFARLQTARTFLDPGTARQALGYGESDVDSALRKTVEACLLRR